MPLQYPNPYNPYQEPSKPRNIPTIILTIIGILTLIIATYFAVSAYGKRGDNPPAENPGIAVGEPNPNGYDCSRDIYNCDNFTTQSEAQVAFDSCDGDPWGLDNDNDGSVCEGLK